MRLNKTIILSVLLTVMPEMMLLGQAETDSGLYKPQNGEAPWHDRIGIWALADVPAEFESLDAVPRQSCKNKTLILPAEASAVTIGLDRSDFKKMKKEYPDIKDTGLRFKISTQNGKLKMEYVVAVFQNPKKENNFKSICKRGIILLKMSEITPSTQPSASVSEISGQYIVQQGASPWTDSPELRIQTLPEEFNGQTAIRQMRKKGNLVLPSGLPAVAIGIHEKDVLFVTRGVPELKPSGKSLMVGKTKDKTNKYEIFCYSNPPEMQNFSQLAKHGVIVLKMGDIPTIVPAGIQPLAKSDMQKADFYLYLLIGQSNMAGRGEIRPIDITTNPRVLTLDCNDKWTVAIEPIHFDKRIAGTGPGLAFGKAMAECDRQVIIGLIPCAVGGTSISSWAKGGKLYENAVQRAKLAAQDGVIKGILWYQGESDVRKSDTAKQYQAKLDTLIVDLRKDLGQPSVPLVVCCLAEYISADPANIKTINDALLSLPQRVENIACIRPDGLTHLGDRLHFNAESYEKLGKRFASAMIKLQNTSK